VQDKEALRHQAWESLERQGVARFPGSWGRIPNFEGASQAAQRLARTEVWRAARVLKCNPDAPQLPLRRLALRQGKVVYMAVPRLCQLSCFIELDPERLGANGLRAASIAGAFKYGRLVRPQEVRPIDLIVCGSVVVSRAGGRIGKGGGYSDLEYALAAAWGKITPSTPIATTVHPLQIIPAGIPMRVHDIPVDYIATSEAVIYCPNNFPRPDGIYWELLPIEKIEAIPLLHHLWQLRAQGPKGPRVKPLEPLFRSLRDDKIFI